MSETTVLIIGAIAVGMAVPVVLVLLGVVLEFIFRVSWGILEGLRGIGDRIRYFIFERRKVEAAFKPSYVDDEEFFSKDYYEVK